MGLFPCLPWSENANSSCRRFCHLVWAFPCCRCQWLSCWPAGTERRGPPNPPSPRFLQDCCLRMGWILALCSLSRRVFPGKGWDAKEMMQGGIGEASSSCPSLENHLGARSGYFPCSMRHQWSWGNRGICRKCKWNLQRCDFFLLPSIYSSCFYIFRLQV